MNERALRSYASWKLRLDPAYRAVLARLRGRESQGVIDLGCGIGLLPSLLRRHGFTGPITGIDFDERKIAAARAFCPGVEFVCADAGDPLPPDRNVVMLDVLQYVDDASQQRILANVAGTIPPGGVAVIRQGLRDDSWRYKLTRFVDAIGRAIRWNRGQPMNFPARESITSAFAGFEIEIAPLWGRTPYNNYLLVFTRRAAERPAE